MRPAIIYTRVSTEGQIDVSLDAQEASIRKWAMAYDYEIVRVYRDEGISGRSLRKRPEAQAAIADACRLKCPLACYSLSRLIRNVKEAIIIQEQFERAGASLVDMSYRIDTNTAMGWFMFIQMATQAELEVRLTAERTRNSLSYLKTNGQRTGSVPYGYDIDQSRPETRKKDNDLETYYPHLTENPIEQVIIAEMREWEASGVGATEIVRRLNGRGVSTKQGGKWHRTTVRNILHPELRPRKKS